MQQLFARFLKGGGVLLFVVLQVICMILIVKNNPSQRQIFISSANYFSSIFYKQFNEATKYYNLYSVADSMARENARLYAQLDNARLKRLNWVDTLVDSTNNQLYTFLPGHVISNSINQHNNTLRLDIGKRQGVEPGMGVVSDDGIVGIVRDVSNNFSSVMSILHKETRISASVKRSGHFGFLTWRGSNPTKMSLIDVPKNAYFEKGDTIATSGYSTIFPKDITIGTIDTFSIRSGSNSWDIELDLNNDMGNLSFVYVVKNLLRLELEELETQSDE